MFEEWLYLNAQEWMLYYILLQGHQFHHLRMHTRLRRLRRALEIWEDSCRRGVLVACDGIYYIPVQRYQVNRLVQRLL